VEEVGREISMRSGTDMLMIPSDFTDILLTHKMKELEAVKQSNKVLFIDTDCLITRFYIDFLDDPQNDKERNKALADAISALNHYDWCFIWSPTWNLCRMGQK